MFFTDTRTLDREVGLLNIHGFDAMLKAEQVWLDPSLDAGEWPMTQAAAAADIARRLGAELDPRTAIEPGAKVEYPNDLSMREVLGYIAMCHGGNWAVTDGGRLLLTLLGGVPKETNYLVEDTWGGAILFGEVRIIV